MVVEWSSVGEKTWPEQALRKFNLCSKSGTGLIMDKRGKLASALGLACSIDGIVG